MSWAMLIPCLMPLIVLDKFESSLLRSSTIRLSLAAIPFCFISSGVIHYSASAKAFAASSSTSASSISPFLFSEEARSLRLPCNVMLQFWKLKLKV